MTFRDLSSHVTIATGHRNRHTGRSEVDWEGLARIGGTLIVLMGVENRREIVGRLISGGRSPDTPAAAVEWGTWPEQRTLRTTLQGLEELDISSPSTLVIGEVAQFDFSSFFESS